MKIGVLTYYGELNCGTNLQAYATLLALRKVYPDDNIEIVDFQGHGRFIKPYFKDATLKTLYNDFIRLKKYNNFVHKELGVPKEYIVPETELGLNILSEKGYDKIYVGADTLLELDRLPKGYDGLSVYWLSKDIKAKKYFLAASCKNVRYDNLSPKQKVEIQETVTGLTGIGVRDKITYELLCHFANRQTVKIVPDPTFTLSIDYSHIEHYLRERKLSLKKVICFHTLRDDYWVKDVAEKLKFKGYKIASLRPAKWADYILNDLSPLEQLGIYKYFDCMVTHRFHDSIFCLKNNTPVICYAPDDQSINSSGESKISDLMESFALEEWLIKHGKSIKTDSLCNKIFQSMEIFNKIKSSIQEKVNEMCRNYYSFLETTK